jgi:hypothetical protein
MQQLQDTRRDAPHPRGVAVHRLRTMSDSNIEYFLTVPSPIIFIFRVINTLPSSKNKGWISMIKLRKLIIMSRVCVWL